MARSFRRSFPLVPALATALVAGAFGSSASAGTAPTPVFNFGQFGSGQIAQMRLNGVATQSPGGTRLSVTPPVANSKGSAWYENEVNVRLGFQSQFTFRVADRSDRGADGFAFVIHNDPRGTTAIGGEGGGLGYARNIKLPTGNAGMTNVIAVEFDTWNNDLNGVGDTPDWPDFNSDNHISLQRSFGTNEILPNETASLARFTLNPTTQEDLNNGTTYTVDVNYDGDLFEVFLNGNRYINLAGVDLGSILGLGSGDISAFIGFTAGTGGAFDVQRHEILSWSFAGVVPTPATATLLALSGVLAARRRRPAR